ncbi:MAG: DUF4469 domain-containing protein [Prevotellaceae bacterium]|jgi:hypothetical protein|nr:DUF4469 domain-containing protein [Prevotellaceae bacterium]
MLQYALFENLLTPAPNDYMAQPQNVRSHDVDDIINRIGERYTGLTPAQLKAAFYEIADEMRIITKEGETVNTPIINTLWSIPGVIEGAVDAIDPKKNPAKLNAVPGSILREAAKQVKLEKVIVSEPMPHILEVKDIASDTVNEQITPGGVIQLRGGRLKFFPDIENDGIFIIDEQGAEIKLSTIVENKPARLIAVLPMNIPQGDYFIEVRTSCSTTGKQMKSLKMGRYNKILTVV